MSVIKTIKLKKCSICTGQYKPFSSTSRVCSPTCAIEFNRQKDIKAEKKKVNKARKDNALRKRVFYANDRKTRKKNAQAAFNAFIRARDEKLPCISCGRHHSGQYHAGHFKTVGAHSELRFAEDNCHKQCSPCNNHLSGNIENYLPNLIKKIGQERYEKLVSYKPIKKMTCEDYKEIETYYKNKLKELDGNALP